MFDKILKILQIERQELPLLILMFLQAGFIGIFISCFDISIHAMFLNYYDAMVIPEVFIYSGIIGIFLFILYTFFSTRLHLRTFILTNYIFILLVTVLIYITPVFYTIKEQVYISYALLFPLNIIVYLNFWRAFRFIFKPEQTKRFNAIIQFSLYGGIITGSYGTILLLFTTLELGKILQIGIISLFVGIILQLIINPVHRFSPHFLHIPKKVNPLKSKLIEMFYTRYTTLLVVFVLLSAITGYLLHFNFISSTRMNYPSIIGFTKFLGLFTGTLFLFTFFVDKLLIRKILYSYDSPYTLILIPVLLILLLSASIVIYFIFGTETAIARFSYFFLIIAIIKVVYEFSKYDIEIPSFRVLFKTLDVRFHGTIIPRVDGTLRVTGLLLSGLLLFGISRVKFIKTIHLNVLTLLVVIAWFIVAFSLIKAFQKALQESIKKLKSQKKGSDFIQPTVDEKLHQLINQRNPEKVIHSLTVSEAIEPITYENHLVNLLKDNSQKLKKYALTVIETNNLIYAYPILKNLQNLSDESLNYRNKLVERFEHKISLGITTAQIEKLAGSKNISDRVLAADLIGYLNKKEFSSLLINLSRDFEPEVNKSAVKAMARIAYAETCHTLIGYLNSSDYYPLAFEALIKMGDNSIPYLEPLFDQSDSDNYLLSRIIKVYGKIGTQEAIDCLLNKIENQNRFLTRQSVTALREAKFQATPANINRIFNNIIRTINLMSWNFSALITLKKTGNKILRDALNSELEDNYLMLYHLMGLAYNTNSIANIQSMLIEGNNTDVSFAIELLDQVVLEEVKQVLFPVLENLSVNTRVKQLKFFFQNEIYSLEELIPEIILRDFNQISVYTKACAIYSWPNISSSVSDILVANLFHPNKLIRETTAYVINKIDSNYLEQIYPRLEGSYVNDIKTSLNNIISGNDFLVLHKIEYLKKYNRFIEIPEEILYEIALNLKTIKLLKDNIISIRSDSNEHAFILIYHGELDIIRKNDDLIRMGVEEILFSNLLFEGEDQDKISIRALNDSTLFTLNKTVLNRLIFDYSEFRNILLDIIDIEVK